MISMSVVLLLIFIGFMILGIPIAISLGAAAVLVQLFMGIGSASFMMITQMMYTSMNSFIMVAVPLFILAGAVMDEGGIADKIYDLADSCVGWIYGGLGHVSVLCNIIFGAMSGSSVAAVASIGKMSINAMAKKGYPKTYGVGINLAGCMLASVIPPSILMIVAASTAGISIGQALMAGLVPGVFIGFAFMIFNYFVCKVKGTGEKNPFSTERLVKSFIAAVPALMVPVILLVGMYSGYYTPTEGAAIAAFYAILISIYVYKRLTWADIPRIIAKNARQTGTILFIAIAAKPAGQIFELDGLPVQLANFIIGISSDQLVILFALYIFLLFVGMFMDATAAIFILVPILLPVINSLGISPLFFVVFLVITLSFGLITPPVGVCLYAAQNVTGLSFEVVVKSVLPWIYLTTCVLAILIFFPEIITGPIDWMFNS